MKILFQGDSITDCGRNREDDMRMGEGYPLLVKGELGLDYPQEYEFINRGISGNRIIDVYARIKKDIINIKPDIMSILVGVNDVWHEVTEENGIDADKYFKIYCMLIEEVKEALPEIKIIIMEPFVLKGIATEENWEYFSTEVPKRAKLAEKVAQKYDLPFIKLQEEFDRAEKLCPSDYWLKDGVHPTIIGHELIKRKWIKTFKDMA